MHKQSCILIFCIYFRVLLLLMESIQNPLFTAFEHQPEEYTDSLPQQKQLQHHQLLQSKYNQFLVSPCFDSTQNKLLNLPSPSPLQKCTFRLIDEQEMSSQESSDLFSSSLPQMVINQFPKFSSIPPPQKSVLEIQLTGQTSKARHQSRRNIKGLRTLSENVYHIVLELKATSYKEVADRLVADFNQNMPKSQNHIKDEQNIKRRVYDALNVLVSASVLKKNGKEVLNDNSLIPGQINKWERIKSSNVLKDLKGQLKEKKKTIKEKRQQIEELRRREQMLKNILTRNRKKKFQNQQHINFPMIGVICDKVHKKGMSLNKPKTYFRLKMDQLICVLGDIDLIMNVDLANQNVDEIMEEQVYEENMDLIKMFQI